MATKKIYALKFTSKSCPACDSMDRSQLLQKFVDSVDGFTIVTRDAICVDEEGEYEKAPYKEAFELSDELDVNSFPTVVFVSEDGQELLRGEIDDFVSPRTRKALASKLVESHNEWATASKLEAVLTKWLAAGTP